MSRRPASADFSQRVAARFASAAQTYDDHSGVQRHAAEKLAGLIATAALPPRPRVLEIGCGTGHLTRLLGLHLPGAYILASDIAPAMVAACRARLPQFDYAVLDGTCPTVPGPFDLICANLAAQWFADLPAALDGLARRLAPGGVLALSLLGADTFCEWRAAHVKLGLTAGTLHFPAANACRAAFPVEGDLQLAVEQHVDQPDSALGFLRGLQAIGADTAAPGHRPLSAAQLRAVLRELGATPRMSYELIYARWRRTP